jgi:ubiquinone/menaquinone biosynthesis C-methylase UbiE
MSPETDRQRDRRHHRRALFDGVAPRYDQYRLGYPDEIVEFVVATAALGANSAVLEVGCGTGQLTGELAAFGFDLTAIDLGAAMVAAAERRVADPAVSFQAVPFEDFTAADGSFDLIVSATAFHWIDPEVRFGKPARLLRPGGWLALLDTGERYDDPFGAALLDLWLARRDDDWPGRPPGEAEAIAATGLFEAPIQRTHEQRLSRPVDAVVGVENTRATSLSWPAAARQEFTERLHLALRSQGEVQLTQETTLTMARVRQPSALRLPVRCPGG